MKNKMDMFLSIRLKNWASRQSPPEGGRRRLLGQIALSEALAEAEILPPDSNKTAISETDWWSPMEWFQGSFMATHLRSLYLDSTFRLVS